MIARKWLLAPALLLCACESSEIRESLLASWEVTAPADREQVCAAYLNDAVVPPTRQDGVVVDPADVRRLLAAVCESGR